MPKGGHGRVGPAPHTAAQRALTGGKERPQHRPKGPQLPPGCLPPPGLSKTELRFWRYYAAALSTERRLTAKTRDTLAKYCTALAMVSDLRRMLTSRKPQNVEARSATRKELRQLLLASRLYENDLLLNPASAIRSVAKGDDPPGVDPLPPDDPFNEFDQDNAAVN